MEDGRVAASKLGTHTPQGYYMQGLTYVQTSGCFSTAQEQC